MVVEVMAAAVVAAEAMAVAVAITTGTRAESSSPTMEADIYCVPVDDRWLVFAPLHSLAALVNDSGVRALRGALGGDDRSVYNTPLSVIAEAAAQATPPASREGPARPPFLGLILTRGCNLDCAYCDFDPGDAGRAMGPDLVAEAVAGWVEWVTGAGDERLDLHFFGGEPFTQPDLIEIAVHRARHLAAARGLTVRVEATTNGLFGEPMLDFVRDHFDSLVLSLDGRQAEHDRHRHRRDGAGSFTRVWRTAEALADSNVELCLRCCVSDANVDRMAAMADWFCRSLRPRAWCSSR